MTNYEIIDAICDSVNPVLLIAAISSCLYLAIKKKERMEAALSFIILFLGLLGTYTILFIENQHNMWESLGHDYSTHTAFALSAVMSLIVSTKRIKLFSGIFIAYCIAMHYQRYHTLTDLISTAIVILPIAIAPLFIKRTYCPQKES